MTGVMLVLACTEIQLQGGMDWRGAVEGETD